MIRTSIILNKPEIARKIKRICMQSADMLFLEDRYKNDWTNSYHASMIILSEYICISGQILKDSFQIIQTGFMEPHNIN